MIVDSQSNLSNADNPFSPVFWKKAGAGALLIKKELALQLSKRIYDAMGYLSDDESEVYSVFRTLKSQSQVSFLSDAFLGEAKVGISINFFEEDFLKVVKRGWT